MSYPMPAPVHQAEETPRDTIRRVLVAAGLPADIAAGYADMICREFSGEAIYFAMREWRTNAERDERIRAERKAGRSLAWLSQQHCLSRTQVWRICGGAMSD